jgi:acyl dehydratase
MSRIISGPWFEDFTVGDEFTDAPSLTITEGFTAIQQALFGERMRLTLDRELCNNVTGSTSALVSPSVVANIVIGQSTYASQRVLGNLFYRGVEFRQSVHVGDTLTTTTRVVALRQNKIKAGRASSGMVALEICARNQRNEEVMHFWRCPMIPCKDTDAVTGHQDSFDKIPEKLDMSEIISGLQDWNLDTLREISGLHFQDLESNSQFEVDARDTVTSAPELVRMTLNMAMTHTDAGRSVYGKRLVYGGHTISMAAAQLIRALPNLVTIIAWHSCDHLAPVFEGDILRSQVTIGNKYRMLAGGLVDLQVEVYAERGDEGPDAEDDQQVKVLDWHLLARFA